MKRILLPVLASAAAVVAIAVARRDRPPSPAGASPVAEAHLRKVIPELCLNNVPLHTAVAMLRAQTGADVRLDADPSGGEVDVTMPVDLHLRDATLRQALEALVDYPGRLYLGFAVHGDSIVVAQHDRLGHYAYARAYDVRDIRLQTLPPGTDSGGCFPNTAPPERVQMDEELSRLLVEMVDSEGWVDNGGLSGAVRTASGRLLVHAPSETHRQIQELLDPLRAAAN